MALIATAVAGIWFLLATPASVLAQRLTPGQRFEYELEYLAASTSNLTGLDQPDGAGDKRVGTTNDLHTRVAGKLIVTVLEKTAERATVALQLREPTVQLAANGALALEQGETIARDLEEPVFVVMDRRGRILSVRFAREMQDLSRSFGRTVYAATQVVLPADVDATAWQAHEEDPNGTYAANYARVSSSRARAVQLEKRRANYLPRPRRHLMNTVESAVEIRPAGKIVIEFDTAVGTVTSIQADEQTGALIENRPVGYTESKLQLRLRGQATADATECAALRRKLAEAGPALTLSTAADTTRRETAIHQTELGDDTRETLLTALVHREANLDEEDTALYLKLKALVYLQRDVCPKLAEVLSAARTDGPTFSLLCGALSSIGHDKAQEALHTAMRARADDSAAMMVLVPALGMVDRPTPATEKTLRDLDKAKDKHVRATAQLALGIVARTLSATEPERTRRIVQETLEKLKTAANAAESRQNLLVLGNIGAAETLPAIKPFLRDETPMVRAAAVSALRWLEHSSVDGLLIEALTGDAEEQVRVEAVQALGLRPMSAASLSAHQQALTRDVSSTVRLSALRNVAQSRAAFPQARDILTLSAAGDPVAEVREEAQRLLAQYDRR
jgi:HEAT repeat protein